jgi:hypothetical protein
MANVIDIILRAKEEGLSATLKKANSRLKSFSQSVRRGFGNIINLAKRVTASVAIIGAAITAAAVKAVRAYTDQARAEAKLEAISKATGFAHGQTTKALKDQAAELQKLTGVGDEVIISMQAMLASFKNISGDEFNRATAAVLDMGAAMRKSGKGAADIESASIQVGKALNDPIKGLSALSRVGVTFTEQQKDQIKVMQEAGDLAGAQAVILSELEGEFGGTAQAMGEASHGLDQLKAAFGDALEVIGKAIVENETFDSVIQSLTKSLEALIESGDLEEWADGIGNSLSNAMPFLKDFGLAIKAIQVSQKTVMEMTGIPALKRGAGKARDFFFGGGDLAESDREVRDSAKRLEEAKKGASELAKAEETARIQARDRADALQAKADKKAAEAADKLMKEGEKALEKLQKKKKKAADDAAAERKKNEKELIATEERLKQIRESNEADRFAKQAEAEGKRVKTLEDEIADIAMNKEERRAKRRKEREEKDEADREKRLTARSKVKGLTLSKEDQAFLKAKQLAFEMAQAEENKKVALENERKRREDEQTRLMTDQLTRLTETRDDLRKNLQAV